DGAGTAELGKPAACVVGLDHDRPSVETARRRHASSHLEFRLADLAQPWPVGDADVVVAFQIIEHFEDDDAFVRHALAALRPGGKLVITTPNRLRSFSENPYHVREYTHRELAKLLERHGRIIDFRGVFGNELVEAFDERRREQVQKWLRLDPLRLRDRLPRTVVQAGFATLSTLVRRRASSEADLVRPITADDFEVRAGDLDDCLDLFVVVERGADPLEGAGPR
ncbi:MAG: methyltransferase domain-containing protein, partial [Nitriliruptorales bacterium]|nr:methyltransferase domain-containing protein [Nitriliruptorales bacterium]